MVVIEYRVNTLFQSLAFLMVFEDIMLSNIINIKNLMLQLTIDGCICKMAYM